MLTSTRNNLGMESPNLPSNVNRLLFSLIGTGVHTRKMSEFLSFGLKVSEEQAQERFVKGKKCEHIAAEG